MLGIHPSHSGQAAVAYHDNSLAYEGKYYLEKTEIPKWEGKTAHYLDLLGKDVDRDDFSKTVKNIDPRTNERLTVRNADKRRSGYDLTFSTPKSVSVLYAMTKDESVLNAHRLAYREAMKNVEQMMQTQANTKSRRFYEHTGNILYAAFDHFTTRPNPIKNDEKTVYIPDPQMHTHCFVPNVTWNGNKKRFQALEMGNIHRQAPWIEAIYHSHLSHELCKVGYQTRRTHERYEVIGVESLLERFSNRTKHIEQVAKEKGITDAKAKAELGAKTRNSKGKSVSEKELDRLWKERLSPAEFATIRNIKGTHWQTQRPITAKEAIDRSLEHHLERNSTAMTSRVLAHALKLGYGTLLPNDVQRELQSRDNILSKKIDTIEHMTTFEMVRAENSMIELATSGKGRFVPLNPAYEPKDKILNDQQRKAIKGILSSRDQVTILKGAAGAGKTTLLKEVKTGIQKSGKSLLAVAPSTQAAQVLKQKEFEASTIAALLHDKNLEQRLKGNTLLVDEAGMVGVKTMSQLLELGNKHGSRIILSGDTKQHGPPGQYGDAQRILEEKAKLKVLAVQKIVRQKPQNYREAIEYMAKGNTLKGFQALDKLGAIKEVPDTDKRHEQIAKDYVSSIKNKRTAIIISPTNYEADMLSGIVREKLKTEERIKGKERVFDTLKNLSFTEAQKKDGANYQDGQILRFIKNQKSGYKAGAHYEVLPLEGAGKIKIRNMATGRTHDLPQDRTNFQVYQKTQTTIAQGDIIRLTNNTKSLESSKLNNGNTYQIKGFTKTGDIKLTNGKTLGKDALHFKQGYVETSYSSQGKDAQDVFIAQSDMSFAASNDQQLYVSASRGTRSVAIYTSDKAELKKAVLRSGERMSANDIADGHAKAIHQRKQRNHHRSLNEKLREHARARRADKQAERGIFRTPNPGRDR